MNKELIKSRFAKNLENYENNAKIQKQMASNLIEYASRKNYKNILELGCGTGFVTRLAVKQFEFERYVAIDLVEECEKYVKPLSGKLLFLAADIEKYLKTVNEKFDLIISNASLQWVNDFEDVINYLKSLLNPNGELIFSTFGKENFREISFLSEIGLNYYSSNELAQMFNAKIEEEIRIMAFDSPKDVLKHLKLTGVNAIENKTWTKNDLKNFENGYANICSSRPTLTYNPIYIYIKD